MYTVSQRGGPRRTGKKYGPNNLRYTRRCIHCLVEFSTSRPDAKFCSGTHRAAYSREKKRREAEQWVKEYEAKAEAKRKRKANRKKPGRKK